MDGSDEVDCEVSSVCSFGTCSHICQAKRRPPATSEEKRRPPATSEEKRHRLSTTNESSTAFCLCAPGYEQTEHKKHCKAMGADPVLLVANENTIRHLDPQHFHTMVRLDAPATYGHAAANEDGFRQLKIESMDVFYDQETPVAFLSLRHNGTIVYVKFVTEVEVHRRRRSSSSSSIINQTTGVLVAEAGKPTGLAIDWINRNLYW